VVTRTEQRVLDHHQLEPPPVVAATSVRTAASRPCPTGHDPDALPARSEADRPPPRFWSEKAHGTDAVFALLENPVPRGPATALQSEVEIVGSKHHGAPRSRALGSPPDRPPNGGAMVLWSRRSLPPDWRAVAGPRVVRDFEQRENGVGSVRFLQTRIARRSIASHLAGSASGRDR